MTIIKKNINFLQKYSRWLIMSKSITQVKEEFSSSGISIASWARDNNFSPDLVYRILNNNRIPLRGKSHEIAVKFGMKEHKDSC